MMTFAPNIRDPMGWKQDLAAALENPALEEFDKAGPVSADARAAAYQVALALGYCRLCHLELPEDLDGTLPVAEATAAAEELMRYIEIWKEEARSLPERWDSEPPGTEVDITADILEARMDAWAVYVALCDTYEEELQNHKGNDLPDFHHIIDRVGEAIDELDEVLSQPEIIELLSVLVHTPLLRNWRLMLGMARPDYDYLPWWLDGTLERTAQQVDAEIRRTEKLLGGGVRGLAREPERLAIRRHSPEHVLQIESVLALAAETSDQEPPISAVLRWDSPDGRWKARLACPRALPEGAQVFVEFFTPDYEPAMELVGWPVWLAGQQASIDEKGRASFDLGALQSSLQANHPFALQVGQEREEWSAAE